MTVTISTTYVGSVREACLAEMGNHAVFVDVDTIKLARLERGEIPIFEPGLEPKVTFNHANGRLASAHEAHSAVTHGDVVFIAVGTPPDEDGSATCATCWWWSQPSVRTSRVSGDREQTQGSGGDH